MNYITAEKIEFLLKNYNKIKSIIDILKVEIEHKEKGEELDRRLGFLQHIKTKLDIGLKHLPEDYQMIIMAKYFECLLWSEIDYNFHINRQKGHRVKNKAINKMIVISRITEKQYKQLMEVIEGGVFYASQG